MSEPITWTIADVARELQLSEEAVRCKVKRREIPFYKMGRLIRFDPDEVRSWWRRKRMATLEELTPK